MRILSLSGGGFQALYTVLCLQRLEENLNAPLRDSFEGFVGTSAGGMIASAAAVGLPMRTLAGIFEKEGKKIFSERPAPKTATAIARDTMRYVSKSKYDGLHLRKIVGLFCGDRTLGQLDRPLMLTAVKLRDGHPVLFNRLTHPDVLLSDAVMASAAAPMMFPAVRVDGELYADGGIFANNPDALALEFAKFSLRADVDDLSIMGVGAMSYSPPLSEPQNNNMGIMAWMSENRIFRTMISAQTILAEHTARNALGDRYLRIDAVPGGPGRRHVALDVANNTAIEAIRLAAEESYPEIDAYCERAASPTRRLE